MAVHDQNLNLTIIFDPITSLPFIIRSYEEHPIFGICTNDLQLTNYTSINGILFPQRFQTIYNTPLESNAVLEDFLVENIEINPSFPNTFFEGLPANESSTVKVAPEEIAEYSHAEIGEFHSNMIWAGEFTARNISGSNPVADLPHLWNLLSNDTDLPYAQIVVEFEDGVIVADAPPHQTLLTIQWVEDNLKKPITHFWVKKPRLGNTIAILTLTAAFAPSQGPHRRRKGLCPTWCKDHCSRDCRRILVEYSQRLARGLFVSTFISSPLSEVR